jgi:polyisoprenoid-binding protein YceI
MKIVLALLFAVAASPAAAAPVVFDIDPTHTYPSFEADHMGISKWRGKFNRSSGTMRLDRERESGTVEVTIDIDSVDFGLDAMREPALGPGFFDVARYPQARYAGTLEDFQDGVPRRVAGELTLHGVTLPLALNIGSFKCIPHPMHGRELCGADATARFDREAHGLAAGKDYGFGMDVDLRIQFEAVARE